MKSFLIFAFTLSLCVSCAKGTNTGNPFSSPAAPQSSYSFDLITAVCQRVSGCFSGVSQNDCLQKVPEITGYPSELGSTAAAYSTMTSLGQAEAGQLISVDRTAAITCLAAINSVECSSSLMSDSFSSSAPSDFTLTNHLFRASSSCQAIFH